MNCRNMRKEFITEDELRGQMRQQGVSDFAEIKKACREANGEISVVKNEDGADVGKKQKSGYSWQNSFADETYLQTMR